MATISVTWHAVMDDRTCPICTALDGYTWVFVTGKDEFPNFISHPAFGVVWDVHRGSMAHGHLGANCRCNMTHETDLSDLLKKVEAFRERVVEGLRSVK